MSVFIYVILVHKHKSYYLTIAVQINGLVIKKTDNFNVLLLTFNQI